MGDTIASDLRIARLLQRLNGARRTSSLVSQQPNDEGEGKLGEAQLTHHDGEAPSDTPD